MTTKLLDTNVCIAVLRGAIDAGERLVAELAEGDLRMSSVTVFELVHGAARSARPHQEMIKINRFIDTGPVPVEFGRDDAEAAGRVRADLAARGLMIGAYDLLIAGHALARGWTVVTANTREFMRVAGLTVEDWTPSSG